MRFRVSSPLRRLGAFLMEGLFNIIMLVVLPLSLVDYIPVNGFFVFLGIWLCFMTVKMFFWTRSTTLGKFLLRMKILDQDTYEPVSFWRMVLRQTLGKMLSGAAMNLGFIWILIDDKSQGWHDKVFGTIVVDENILVEGESEYKDYDPYVKG